MSPSPDDRLVRPAAAPHLVILPVPGALPQLDIVDVGGDNLIESTLPVLLLADATQSCCRTWQGQVSKRSTSKCAEELYPDLDELDEGVVDAGAVGQEKARARAQLVEEEQLLLLPARESSIATSG